MSRISNLISDHIKNLIDFLFTAYCVCCNERITDSGSYICCDCREKVSEFGGRKIVQPEKVGASVYFYLYPYEPFKDVDMGSAVRTLKYKGHFHLAEELAAMMIEACGDKPLLQEVDIFTSIPLHSARRRERGFNQSASIAKCIADEVGADYTDLLLRIKNTPKQAELSSAMRELNVKDVFRLRQPADIVNKRIVLVDDQITTGSTLDNAAKVLILSGAASVVGLSVTH